MATVFVAQPTRPEFESVYRSICAAAQTVGATALRADSGVERGSMVEQVYRHLESADVVIADITLLNSNVMYELGFAHGAKRPVIVISGNLPLVPFDIASVQVIRYEDSPADRHAFEREMKEAISGALDDPASFARRPTPRTDINRRSSATATRIEECLTAS